MKAETIPEENKNEEIDGNNNDLQENEISDKIT